MRMVHNVFFTLNDCSDTAAAKLVADCKKYLTAQPGLLFFAAGTMAKDSKRPVNDRDWDVSLHMVFATPEQQAAYQDEAEHQRFIAANKASWANVRVFDSLVD